MDPETIGEPLECEKLGIRARFARENTTAEASLPLERPLQKSATFRMEDIMIRSLAFFATSLFVFATGCASSDPASGEVIAGDEAGIEATTVDGSGPADEASKKKKNPTPAPAPTTKPPTTICEAKCTAHCAPAGYTVCDPNPDGSCFVICASGTVTTPGDPGPSTPQGPH